MHLYNCLCGEERVLLWKWQSISTVILGNIMKLAQPAKGVPIVYLNCHILASPLLPWTNLLDLPTKLFVVFIVIVSYLQGHISVHISNLKCKEKWVRFSNINERIIWDGSQMEFLCFFMLRSMSVTELFWRQ